jgi:hypothetical protein
MEEAIPERFLDLLEKLDEADRARRDPTNRESPGNDG